MMMIQLRDPVPELLPRIHWFLVFGFIPFFFFNSSDTGIDITFINWNKDWGAIPTIEEKVEEDVARNEKNNRNVRSQEARGSHFKESRVPLEEGKDKDRSCSIVRTVRHKHSLEW